jgi:hypothetical protein
MDTKVFPPSFLHGYGHRVLLRHIVLSVPVLLMLCFASCANVGRTFPVSRVPEIQIGKTTQDEIREMFGSPWRIGIEDGRRTWTYGKYRYRVFGEPSTEDLVIRFDEHNVVVSYTFNTTEHHE